LKWRKVAKSDVCLSKVLRTNSDNLSEFPAHILNLRRLMKTKRGGTMN